MGEPQEPALCPHSLGWGKGLARISTQLQPCPTGQLGEAWHCLLPLHQAQILPAQAGASLCTAMGPREVGGKGAMKTM